MWSDYILRHLRLMGQQIASKPWWILPWRYYYFSSTYLDFFLFSNPFSPFQRNKLTVIYDKIENIGHVPVHSPFWREKHNESGILTVFLITWSNVLGWRVYNGSQLVSFPASGLAVTMRLIATGVFIGYSPWHSFKATEIVQTSVNHWK